MSLLNHLFRPRKEIVHEVMARNVARMQAETKIALWKQYVDYFNVSEKLCKYFHYGNVDDALKDIPALNIILQNLVNLIPSELITIEHEEKTEDELLSDLKFVRTYHDIDEMGFDIVLAKEKEVKLRVIFTEITQLLKTKLHLIQALQKNPTKELLLQLFELIHHREARYLYIFQDECYTEGRKHMYAYIEKMSRAMLLEEKIEEEKETDEEKFVTFMIEHMAQGESRHSYRILAEEIYSTLVAKAGWPKKDGMDTTKGIAKMEKLMVQDPLMFKLVKKLRSAYTNQQIMQVVVAFRSAYDMGHFIDLEDEFVT